MNDFIDPSPVQSLRSFTTSPTRGEVILTDAKSSHSLGEVIHAFGVPSPLVGEGAPQGRVRGLKHHQQTRHLN